MSLQLRNLSVIGYAQGFTLWHLTANFGPVIADPDYFAPAADMLVPGDMVLISSAAGAAQVVVTSTDPVRFAVMSMAAAPATAVAPTIQAAA